MKDLSFSVNVNAPHRLAPITVLEAGRQSATPIRRVELLDASDNSLLNSALAGRPALIAISPTVNRLYGQAVRTLLKRLPEGQAHVCILAAGERRKTLSTVEWLVAQAHRSHLPRDGVLVGIGGGVLLDIVGLAACLYRRGVPHIKIGTTLVAQVDAAVGLKCGVNSDNSKNLVGAFYPPELVLTDGGFLHTLESRDIRCGIAEIVKMGIVCDGELFHALSDHGELLLESGERNGPECKALIDRAIAGMIDQLNANPYETSLQRAVDYGHSVSGVLEIATKHDLRHGEAVALDMALFATVSALLGSLQQHELDTIITLLQRMGLAVWHPIMADGSLLKDGLSASAAHRGRKLNMPLPMGIGRCAFIEDENQIPSSLLAKAAEYCRERHSHYIKELRRSP